METIGSYNFNGKKALVRVDFNVPLNAQFEITDNTRIRAALPTVKKILESGGLPILISHLGRPKTGYEEKFSLKHLIKNLSGLLGCNVIFAQDCVGPTALNAANALKPGEALLLENLRFHAGEKAGEMQFARQLSQLADVYVNDAFGTAHRAHASTSIVAKFFPQDKMFGYLLEKEIANLDKVLNKPKRPFTAVLGGAKVSGKIEVITRLLSKVDHLIIGGGMSFTFAKALGGHTGNSLLEEDKLVLALDLIKSARERGVSLLLPPDTITANAFTNEALTGLEKTGEIPDGWMGLDIGPESEKLFSKIIARSKTILWNGPMGVFEMPKFESGTKSIAHAIAEATSKGSFSLVGGGDSVAAINKYGLKDRVSYMSTGGGAMLEYIEGKELPGIKAILD